MMDYSRSRSRRRFLFQTAAVLGSWSVAPTLRRLLAEPIRREVAGGLRPTRDETTGLSLLMLPDGFRYQSFGWIGDAMSDGVITPSQHDGMGVIADDDGLLTICRNQEVNDFGVAFGQPKDAYDQGQRTLK